MLEMKSMHNEIRFAYMMAALLFAACTAEDPASEPKNEGAVIRPRLEFRVSDMTMSEVSRASAPMSPDHEKYVRTMAIFEFDNEGLHEKGGATYHFIDFIAGTVDGKKDMDTDVKNPTEFGVVESSLEGLKFEQRDYGTICLLANVTEKMIDSLYKTHRDPGQSSGRLRLDQFKKWALPFVYPPRWTDVYDDSRTGHISDMYMFGYYYGPIEPSEAGAIRVDLGRLASRLDITVVNDTGEPITKRLGYHLDKVCVKAFFFPMKEGLPPIDSLGIARTVICSGPDPVEGDDEQHKIVPEQFPAGGVSTHYFYVAAHSAKNYEEATILHLFYDRVIPRFDAPDEPSSFKVPLCNVHPLQAANVPNGYSLSRNTRYHFTIRLKKKDSATSSRAGAENTVVYGDRPGEITVYLP